MRVCVCVFNGKRTNGWNRQKSEHTPKWKITYTHAGSEREYYKVIYCLSLGFTRKRVNHNNNKKKSREFDISAARACVCMCTALMCENVANRWNLDDFCCCSVVSSSEFHIFVRGRLSVLNMVVCAAGLCRNTRRIAQMRRTKGTHTHAHNDNKRQSIVRFWGLHKTQSARTAHRLDIWNVRCWTELYMILHAAHKRLACMPWKCTQSRLCAGCTTTIFRHIFHERLLI